MNVLALTCGTQKAASSRLRSYYLFSEPDFFQIIVRRKISFFNFLNADIIHFQKTLRPKFFLLNVVGLIIGKKTIFDVDDQPHNLGVALSMYLNILFARLVVVDTPGRQDYWRKKFPFKRIVVVPDVLDVDKSVSLNALPEIDLVGIRRLVWIGHPDNIQSILPVIRSVNLMNDCYSLTIITRLDAIQDLKERFKNIEFVAWYQDVLFSHPGRYQFMILNHDAGEDASLKSENKMALALAAGIVPIVSNTPAYAKLAKIVGCEKFIFNDIQHVLDIARSASNHDCHFLASAREYVVDHFSPKRILQILISEILK